MVGLEVRVGAMMIVGGEERCVVFFFFFFWYAQHYFSLCVYLLILGVALGDSSLVTKRKTRQKESRRESGFMKRRSRRGSPVRPGLIR